MQSLFGSHHVKRVVKMFYTNESAREIQHFSLENRVFIQIL